MDRRKTFEKIEHDGNRLKSTIERDHTRHTPPPHPWSYLSLSGTCFERLELPGSVESVESEEEYCDKGHRQSQRQD